MAFDGRAWGEGNISSFRTQSYTVPSTSGEQISNFFASFRHLRQSQNSQQKQRFKQKKKNSAAALDSPTVSTVMRRQNSQITASNALQEYTETLVEG